MPPRCIHVILNCEILDGTLEGVAEKRKVNLVLGFNILCNFWNLSPNRSFDCRARGSEELCFNFKGAHFQQRLQTFIALWTISKLWHWFVKIGTWISLSCYMDLSKLIHGFLLVVAWIFKGAHFQQHLQTFIALWTRSKILEETNGNKRDIDKKKCIWVENNRFASILRLEIVRLY